MSATPAAPRLRRCINVGHEWASPDCQVEFDGSKGPPDATCPPCRAAETAANLALPPVCVRCGAPARVGPFIGSPTCDACQTADLLENIRRWGNE